MIVHYRLPNQGWLTPHTLELDDLWKPEWVRDVFRVSTQAEWDFLQAYGLMKGTQLIVFLDPTFRFAGPWDTCLWLKDINTNTFNPRIPGVCESDISSG